MNDAYHALIRGQRSGVLAALKRAGLRTLSLGYRLGVSLRNLAFERGWRKTFRAPVPVVSVGNLTTGGTGKTPCVEYVARFYRQLGLQVALLSRGYGSEAGRNDEALVLEENLPDVPHLQGGDRVSLAQTAVEELETEILVLDDGFQHRRLQRDLDIVLIDATCPWGYGYLLPRGLLREPIGSLKRADVAMLTRCDLVRPEVLREIRVAIARVTPGLPIIESVHRPAAWRNAAGMESALDDLRDRPIAAFCGIGNPEGFRQTLAGLGINVVAWRTFSDHHAYTRADIEELQSWARQLPADAVLATTQKDLVKIRVDQLGERALWALAIRLEVTSGQDALEFLLRKTAKIQG
ncbi:MAG: tetraacyldisaccharide 4'-kinase [Planctomycetes bacterium]|nr:tetraacyldisaccharide 4'-kinase [Planctomycetota bacterium]